MTDKSRLVASTAAAGERPAISRHSRHPRHRSYQIAASKWFASVTRNTRPLPTRVTGSAFRVTRSSLCVGRAIFRD
jgi:hypothetical protein